MKNFKEWKNINEYADLSRYSIEVNFKTNLEEVIEAYSKITLGYISAAIKKMGYHTKHVYVEKPIRLLTSLNKKDPWDEGEWVVIVSWDKSNKCFAISAGFYNKMRQTVSIEKTEKCSGKDASEIYKELFNKLESLKNEPSKKTMHLNPIKKKRGPKSN
jgi:hypothetical protein